MYSKYFLMKSEPFAPFPDPSFFYPSKGHEKTWWYLVQSLKQKDPVVLTTGEYGAGKTLLCLKLLRLMEKKSMGPKVYLPSPGYTFPMLLEEIAREFGIGDEFPSETVCRRRVYEYLESQALETNRDIYILIDDIDEFDHDFLTGINKLITYNYKGIFPIKLFMFGHASFLNNLTRNNFLSFRQRIKTMPHVSSLNSGEVTEYIYYRLISSGASGNPVFDDDAVQMIAAESGGVPRLINRICDNSLMVACQKGRNVIDTKIVTLGLEKFDSISSRPSVMHPPGKKKDDPDTSQELQRRVKQRQPDGMGRSRDNFCHEPRDTNSESNVHEHRKPAGSFSPHQKASVHLFDSDDEDTGTQTPGKEKPMDGKKPSFFDTRNVLIASLVVIIILLLLSLFRGAPFTGTVSYGTDHVLEERKVIVKSISEHIQEDKKENNGITKKKEPVKNQGVPVYVANREK